MVVHLEGGVAATACEAHHVVLAVIDHQGGLVDGDVIGAHVEDDADFSLILWKEKTKSFYVAVNITVDFYSWPLTSGFDLSSR